MRARSNVHGATRSSARQSGPANDKNSVVTSRRYGERGPDSARKREVLVEERAEARHAARDRKLERLAQGAAHELTVNPELRRDQ